MRMPSAYTLKTLPADLYVRIFGRERSKVERSTVRVLHDEPYVVLQIEDSEGGAETTMTEEEFLSFVADLIAVVHVVRGAV